VSTFYLLPPRPFVGQRLADALRALLPGLDLAADAPAELADVLLAAVARRPDVFVVHREDLAEGEDAARALADGFGAEADDEVVEVRAGARPGELTARRWRLGASG
jgi:hypothetical protein